MTSCARAAARSSGRAAVGERQWASGERLGGSAEGGGRGSEGTRRRAARHARPTLAPHTQGHGTRRRARGPPPPRSRSPRTGAGRRPEEADDDPARRALAAELEGAEGDGELVEEGHQRRIPAAARPQQRQPLALVAERLVVAERKERRCVRPQRAALVPRGVELGHEDHAARDGRLLVAPPRRRHRPAQRRHRPLAAARSDDLFPLAQHVALGRQPAARRDARRGGLRRVEAGARRSRGR
eukprot:1493950-Prymnesium_polylepis.2